MLPPLSFLLFTILQLMKLKLRNIKACPKVTWTVSSKMKTRPFLFPILYCHWNTYTPFNSQQDSMRWLKGTPIRRRMKVLGREKRDWAVLMLFSPNQWFYDLKILWKLPKILLEGKFPSPSLTFLCSRSGMGPKNLIFN